MFWALARASFRAAKIVSCNKNFFFMVYDQNYHNCSSLSTKLFLFPSANIGFSTHMKIFCWKAIDIVDISVVYTKVNGTFYINCHATFLTLP
jgi:hypothetical protein